MKKSRIYILLTIFLSLFFICLIQDNNDRIYIEEAIEDLNFITFSSYNIPAMYEWRRTWGGRSYDEANSIGLDSSDNIYIAGYLGGWNEITDKISLVKYNNLGEYQWERTWGGEIGDEQAKAIVLDSSDNIFLAGVTRSFGSGNSDMCLVKYDHLGTQQWNRTWGGSGVDQANSIALDSLNNIFLAGHTTSYGAGSYDIVLVKFDNMGQYQWNITFGGIKYDYAYAIAIDSLNNIYIAGVTGNTDMGPNNMTLVKYNNFGEQQWNLTWGGEADDSSYSLALDSSDNIYLAGSTSSYGAGGSDMCVIKYNSAGIQQWNFTWGGTGYEFISSLTLDSSNNMYLAGSTSSFGAGGYDMCLVKYNSFAQYQWNLTWGGSYYDLCNALALDLSDNIYLAGRTPIQHSGITEADMCLVKYNMIPEITINSPTPFQLLGNKSPTFELTINKPTLNNMWYSLNNGLNFSFIETSGMINQTAWDLCGNGTVIINFYTNDTYGNVEVYNVTVRKDTSFPAIIINSPTPYQLFGIKTLNFTLSIIDDNLDSTWYSLNGGINYTFSGISGIINQSAWDECGNGTIIIRFYANNSANNIAWKEVIVRKDIHVPTITIISPDQYQMFGNITFNFDLSIVDDYLDSTWYSLNDGINYTFSGTSGIINQSAWDECDNGTVIIRFYANNSLGNVGFKDLIVRKDSLGPLIIINSPSAYQIFGNRTFSFDLSIIEPNLNTTWYTLNYSSKKHIFFGDSGEISQSAWDEYGNGTVLISFYGNDTWGNIGFNKITLRKDIVDPVITIYSPYLNQLFGNRTFHFQLSITESNLNTTWYSLNGGDNYTFSGTNGIIDRIAWDMCDNGTVLLKFYANDYAGNIGNKEILIKKDVNFITYIDLTGSPIHIDNLDPNNNWLKAATENEWCSGSGTINNPFIIEYVIIDGQNSGTCIFIENSDVNFIIRDCILNNSGSSDSGIKLINTTNGYISENSIHHNDYGIYFENSNANSVIRNNVYNHQTSGIYFYYSDNNQIHENSIDSVNYAGLFIHDGSDINTISENNITNIDTYGIVIGGFSPKPQNNLIFRNNFTNNSQHATISILDSKTKWDNGSIGNYWDDYSGFDLDGDDIGDKPYYIDIVSDEKDRFPIWSGEDYTFEWLKTKDYGVWGLSDIGKAIAIDNDGYIYVTGTITVTNDNIILLKYNSLGELQWQREWGGGMMDEANGIAIDLFGNIYIVGYTETSANNEDILLIKYDNNGVLQWTQTWDGGLRDGAEGVAIDSFGDIYITGYTQTYTPNLYNMILIKYNSTGSYQWNKTWTYASQSFGKGVSIDSSGNIFVAGFYYGGLGSNMFTIKYDNMGNYIWEIRWGIRAYNDVSDLVIDSQDTIYVAGTTWNSGSNFDMCFWKIGNAGGTPIYNRVYDRNLNSEGNGIVIDSFDNIFLVGSYGNDITLVKYDKFGNFQYHENWGEDLDDIGYAIALNNYDTIFICGTTESYAENGIDIFILKYLKFPESPFININNGAETTNSTLVTLTLSALYAEEMSFKNGSSGSWSVWEPYKTIKQIYLEDSINNTLYSISVKFRNSKGETVSVNDSILLIYYFPESLSININNGVQTTNSTLISLTISSLYADEMCFKIGVAGTWTPWESYSTSKILSIPNPQNNTIYTIYVKFRNEFGESIPISDDILYLVYPPLNPYILINGGDLRFNSTSLELTLFATNADEMCFKIDVAGTWTSWEPYQITKILDNTNPQNNTIYTIYVKFRNEFGESVPISDDILYLVYPPINPFIILNSGDLRFNSTSLELTLFATNADEMCFKIGMTGTWTSWESYSTSKILSIPNPQNNTIYTIYVKFRNEFGESVPISDDILYLLNDKDNPKTRGQSISSGFHFLFIAIAALGSLVISIKRSLLRN